MSGEGDGVKDARQEDKIHFWENVYGFNMSLMKRELLLTCLAASCCLQAWLCSSLLLILFIPFT